ncbi:MAG: hypothetical protein L0Y68_04075 [Candidatus Dadabacteria bacterium]|nr:hypothetical protein [Candidatus Dadabacteria bacterium]
MMEIFPLNPIFKKSIILPSPPFDKLRAGSLKKEGITNSPFVKGGCRGIF